MPGSQQLPTRKDLYTEIESLRSRLLEVEELLQAIRTGEVDALLVEGPSGEQVFTLKGAEHGYRILVETMNEGALTVHVDGIIHYANVWLTTFLKLPLEQIMGSHIQQFLDPEHLPEFEKLLQQSGNRRGEFNLLSREGRMMPVLISMSTGPEDDLPGTIYVVITDLTEQRHVVELQKAQVSLRESERRFRTLAEAIPQLSWTCLPDGRCDYLSQQWVDYTGSPMEEQLGLAWLDNLHSEDREGTLQAWEKAFPTGTDFDREFRIRASNGQYRWFKTRGIPVRDSEGKITKWFGTCTDIEEIVQARHVLTQGREDLESLVGKRTAQLQETTDQLNNFCYSVAHDLRAPLRAQSVYARTLLEDYGDVLGETGQGYAGRIINAAEKLDRLVQDLLSHVSLSRGDLPLEPVELRSVVSQVLTDFNGQIDKAKAQVTLHTIEGRVMAHGPSLNLIVTNLVSNALKYCKPGVCPDVSIRTEWKENGTLRLWVEDDGIGIKPEYHERIFGVFQRLHTADTYPGTGIGLALVRKGLERMGGKVGVESTFGKGSRFWIDLQQATPLAR